MSKITVYKCDWCKNVLSDRGAGTRHISLAICEGSGRANRETPLIGWRIDRAIAPGVYHWCSSSCLAQWTDTVLEMA